MSCSQDWLYNPTNGTQDEIEIAPDAIVAQLYEKLSFNEIESIMRTWSITRQVFVSINIFLFGIAVGFFILKRYLLAIVGQYTNSRNKANHVRLNELLNITSPIVNALFWLFGGGICEGYFGSAGLSYAVLLALNCHLAAIWLRMIENLVKQQKEFQRMDTSSNKNFMLIAYPAYGGVLISMFSMIYSEELGFTSFRSMFKVLYMFGSIPVFGVGVYCHAFSRKAIRALTDLLEKSSVTTASREKLVYMKKKIQFLAFFFVGSSVTVCVGILLVAFTNLIEIEGLFHGIVSYFCSLFFTFNLFGVISEIAFCLNQEKQLLTVTVSSSVFSNQKVGSS